MPCTCSETYTVTDTWVDEYYIVPAVSEGDLGEVPGCDCGDKAPSGNPINGKQYYEPCSGESTGAPQGGSPTQDPKAGEKIAIGEPKKTDSKKQPESQKCGGNCTSTPGPVTIVKDEKEVVDQKTVSVDYEVKNVTLRCSCQDKLGNTMNWDISCKDYKTTIDLEADVYKRTRVQQYTVSVSCQS